MFFLKDNHLAFHVTTFIIISRTKYKFLLKDNSFNKKIYIKEGDIPSEQQAVSSCKMMV